jgi:hypothetical protein
VLLAALVGPLPARAETLDDARVKVAAAADRLAALKPRVERALRAYDRSLRDLAGGVSRSIVAQQDADAADQAEHAARAQENQRVRALYMTGGAALYATVLTAGGPSDALARVQYVQRLVSAGASLSATSSSAAEDLRGRAGRLEVAAETRVVTAADVQRRYEMLQAALDKARSELAALSGRARALQEAQDLLAQVAALNAEVDASGSARVAAARAGGIPPLFEKLYVAAARTCPGMSWTLLAAIGQVESGHGANPGTSYAGAQGPMQFMPSTFASYAVDGDKDGDRDIMDPADAVFTAAHYLCANGAGRGGDSLARAIWHYNHADWYVQLVLKLAGQYAESSPATPLG